MIIQKDAPSVAVVCCLFVNRAQVPVALQRVIA